MYGAMIEGWKGCCIVLRALEVRDTMCRFFGDLQIARNDEETASHGAVLCSAEGASVFAAVCHDKRAGNALLSSYERSKFAKTNFRFLCSLQIARNEHEALHSNMPCGCPSGCSNNSLARQASPTHNVSGIRFSLLHSKFNFVNFVKFPNVAGSDSNLLLASSRISRFIKLPNVEGSVGILLRRRTSWVRRVKCAHGSMFVSLLLVSESEISVCIFISAIFSGRISISWPTRRRWIKSRPVVLLKLYLLLFRKRVS